MQTSNTTVMHPALTAELVRLGWNPARVGCWGNVVSGNVHGVRLERNGIERHYSGPFTSVEGGGQLAIVR